jgi:hypothetical protein
MIAVALLVGAGAGLGAVAFRYLVYGVTWLATGHTQFGQDGYVGSSHLPWLGLGFFVLIPATFNAPITGIFFGVEIILREFSVEAICSVMLSAVLADVVAEQFLGSRPFLAAFPDGLALHHATGYLLVAALAVIAALLGLGFGKAVYAMEDLWDAVWKGRPEWARPAVGGLALGLLLLALPQMYGVGYPVMDKATDGRYVLWFLVVLAAGKILATSLTLGIGGSGGVFAPSLFIRTTSGMAFGVAAGHLFGTAAGPPARRLTSSGAAETVEAKIKIIDGPRPAPSPRAERDRGIWSRSLRRPPRPAAARSRSARPGRRDPDAAGSAAVRPAARR